MAKSLTENVVGAIAYTLTVDGEVVDVVDRDDPIEYLHGAENIVPGLEAALEGKSKGDKFDVVIQPEDGYGEYDEEDVQEIPADEFDDLKGLKVGMDIELMDEDGESYEATIIKITPKAVTLDFNPPLAGKVLNYSVEVIDVREATESELDMGLPASLLADLYGDDDFDHDHDH